MSFGIYMVGFVIMLIGLVMGAHYAHIPPRWIGAGVVFLVGLGILLGVTSTRTKDVSR